jgi:putative PIN family toxin of toxin-antitoxin system
LALIQPLCPSAEILRGWRDGQIELILCPELLSELASVLMRPRLRSRISEDQARAFVRLLRSQAELRADPAPVRSLTADPNDRHVVALGQATRADYIVSANEPLASVTRLPVLTPRAMVEVLEGRRQNG